ncbi:MAG: hypothetical protein WBU92_05475 [Candidatus Dormiibacterota bacterium]
MLNVPAEVDAEARRRVVEDFGRYFGRWGLAPSAGRLWGYLLMRSAPASLDQIAADLQISKSSASVAARQLEQILLARRSGQPGSRRALYEATEYGDHFMEMVVDAYRAFLDLFESAARATQDQVARDRLEGMNRFYCLWVEQLSEVIERWRQEHR